MTIDEPTMMELHRLREKLLKTDFKGWRKLSIPIVIREAVRAKNRELEKSPD